MKSWGYPSNPAPRQPAKTTTAEGVGYGSQRALPTMPARLKVHRPFPTRNHKRHHPNGDRPHAAARGYDRDWKRLRKWKLRRDPICELCGKAAASMVHHVKKIVDCPDCRLRQENLQSVCRACHDRVHKEKA